MSVTAPSRTTKSARPSRKSNRGEWKRETLLRPRLSSPSRWPTETHRAPSHRVATEPLAIDCTGLAEAADQIFHMMLASLNGYRDIADTSVDPELRNFAETIVRQRRAQCRALAELVQSDRYSPFNADPAAEQTKAIWLLAMWHFDQSEPGGFFEFAEAGEMILEEACLSAAKIYAGVPGAHLFGQFALTVCGARQRLEELSNGLL